MVILLIIAFVLICFLDLPKLVNKNMKYELVVTIVFLTVAFIFSFLLVVGVQIPSPLTPIVKLFEKLGLPAT